MTEQELREKIAEEIYEATRLEAEWSSRRIVPEYWDKRDSAFRKQFVDTVNKYIDGILPTPEEAHNSWMRKYFEMGWVYGKVRDAENKTHPDLVPYNDLPQDEKDKDAIFLALIYITSQILTLIKEAGWKSPDNCSERKDVLLKATYDLLKKCDNSPFVVDVFSEVVFYDEADCDGYCLMEDIKNELRIYDE